MDIESGLKKRATSGDTALHSQPIHNPALEIFGTNVPLYASLPEKDEGADESDDSMFDVLSNAPLKAGDDFEYDSLNAPLTTGDDFEDSPPSAPLKTGDTTKEDLVRIVQSLNSNLADRSPEEIEKMQQAIIDSLQF